MKTKTNRLEITLPVFSLVVCTLLLSASPVWAQESDKDDEDDKGDFASLVIDQRDGNRYGWAVDHPSPAAAQKRALKECEKLGGDCHEVLWFKGGCGAYVVERGSASLYGWATADTRTAAQNRARAEARARGGKDLVVRVWGCNDGKLEKAEETTSIKGVYSFHILLTTDPVDEKKKCFVTDALYHPQVARKKGDKWVWTKDAKQKMLPAAEKFMDGVGEELYGFLGENKDKAVKRREIDDWAGKNEVEHAPAALKLSTTVRQKKMKSAAKDVRKMCKDQGAKLFVIDVDG